MPVFSQLLSFPPICTCFSNCLFFHSLLTLFVSLSFPSTPSADSHLLSLFFFLLVSSYFLPSPLRLPPCFLPYSVRDKFVEVDLKPVCKHCYERLPDDMRRRLAKRERDSKEKKKKPLIPMCLWCSFYLPASTIVSLVSFLLLYFLCLFLFLILLSFFFYCSSKYQTRYKRWHWSVK